MGELVLEACAWHLKGRGYRRNEVPKTFSFFLHPFRCRTTSITEIARAKGMTKPKNPTHDAAKAAAPAAVFAALPLIAFLLVGCSVGPRYKGTTAKLQPFHTAPSIEARKAPLPAPALDTWWEGFRDPELTHIVQRAIYQNLDLAAALTRVEQARAAAREAGTRFKPSGALTAQADSFRQSLESPAGRFARTSPTYERNQSYLDLA